MTDEKPMVERKVGGGRRDGKVNCVIRIEPDKKRFMLDYDKYAKELNIKPSMLRAVNFIIAELGYNLQNDKLPIKVNNKSSTSKRRKKHA